jgi:hypothetical protein
MITLNEEQSKELNNNLLEMPTKYGYPLILWFKQINAEQNGSEEKPNKTEVIDLKEEEL